MIPFFIRNPNEAPRKNGLMEDPPSPLSNVFSLPQTGMHSIPAGPTGFTTDEKRPDHDKTPFLTTT